MGHHTVNIGLIPHCAFTQPRRVIMLVRCTRELGIEHGGSKSRTDPHNASREPRTGEARTAGRDDGVAVDGAAPRDRSCPISVNPGEQHLWFAASVAFLDAPQNWRIRIVTKRARRRLARTIASATPTVWVPPAG